MTISYNRARQILRKWQPLLKLQDWDIQIQIVATPWRKSGDIKIDAEDRKAILLLNQRPLCTNPHELIVHELLHLKLWDMDQMIEGLLDIVFDKRKERSKRDFAYTQFMRVLETTVEDLAKGFLATSGNDRPLSFGRLRQPVQDEISGK